MPEIHVTDEQGNVHVFPDGSTPEMIAQAMNVKPPSAQPAPPAQQPKEGAASRFLRNFEQTLGVLPEKASDYLQGPKQLLTHPIESAKLLGGAAADAQQRVIDQAYQEQHSPGLANKASGLVRGLYGSLPLVGPALNQAGTQFQQGDVAGGLGTTLGVAAPAVAGEVAPKAIAKLNSVGGLADAAAARMYQSALKPSVAKYSTERVGQMVQTGLQNEIPVSAAGSEKLASLVSDLNDAVKAKIQAGQSAGATISRKAVAARLLDTGDRFKTQVAPEQDLAAIQNVGDQFYRNQPSQIPVQQAQNLKVGTYQQLRGKYGQISSAQVEAEKALARGIKEELEQQFPEIKGLNAQEAKLINLDEPLQRAVRRIDNQQLLGIGTPIAAAAGGAVGGGPGAIAMAVMKAAVDDPIVKSKLAIMLSKGGKLTIPQVNTRLAGYTASLMPRTEEGQ